MTSPDIRQATAVPDATGLVIGVVSARMNADIVARLVAGAQAAIAEAGATPLMTSVAGSFELPFAASVLAHSGDVDAVVVIGAVIDDESGHYALVSEGCAAGVMDVQLQTGVPVGLGVVMADTRAQALERCSDEHNEGRRAAIAAMEGAVLARAMLPAPE